jgi:16S rRNA (guanine527-N7)-methyltransferase
MELSMNLYMQYLKKYFPEITNDQLNKFILLEELYKDWNKKINVISRKDIDNLEIRHILPSLAISRAVDFIAGKKVLDIGTGGGLPGIPLAIIFPQTEFLLIDSIGKKIKVVEDIIKKLELTNVRCEITRSETVKEKFDYVLGRAVIAWPEFVKMSKKNLKPDGQIIYLAGGEIEVDWEKHRVFDLEEWFNEAEISGRKIFIYKN